MSDRVNPEVQAALDEASAVPDSTMKVAMLERAARIAEALGDMRTAWRARLRILQSSVSHEAPNFENLILTLGWCLAMSDSDPEEFCATHILWQYKWVATSAPGYASVPRPVLERLVADMDSRMQNAGWGRRAGLHKRWELLEALGEMEEAQRVIDAWQRTPRDRGSDCQACEASSYSDFLTDVGQYEAAARQARPIMLGRLVCSTVPHSTFGKLAFTLLKLGREKEARELYERGRRLVAAMGDGSGRLVWGYVAFGAFIGDVEGVAAMLRKNLPIVPSLTSDLQKFGVARAMLLMGTFFARRGLSTGPLPCVAEVVEQRDETPDVIAARGLALGRKHAALLDARNGNSTYATRLEAAVHAWEGLVVR